MPSLREVRTRIASIKSTRQITSAMKMVSSTKLVKAQRSITALKPYAENLWHMIDLLYTRLQPNELSRLVSPSVGNKALVFVIASNKGLCGAYNTITIKKTIDRIQQLNELGFEVQLLIAGRKAEEFFSKTEYNIYKTDHSVIDGISFKKSAEFANELMQLFENNYYHRIDVVYNRFRSAMVQDLIAEQLLPVPIRLPDNKTPIDQGENIHPLPTIIFEPSAKEISESLIPKYFHLNVYNKLLNASASEHGVRMSAMQKATDNATELLKVLNLTYNKVRQAMITREIVEIVSGAEVFNE